LQNIFWFVVHWSSWFARSAPYTLGQVSGVFAINHDSGYVGLGDSFRVIYYDLKYLRNFVEFKK
jgi:hypothetical protein